MAAAELSSVEQKPNAEAGFVDGLVPEHYGVGAGAGAITADNITKIEMAEANIDHPARGDLIGNARHCGPGKILLRALAHHASDRRRIGGVDIVHALQPGDAGAAADIGREAAPGAEVDIAVHQHRLRADL